MKSFSQTQIELHENAIAILKEYQQQKNMVKSCSEAIGNIERGSLGYLNSKAEFQEAGDVATGKMMAKHAEYYQVLRQITEPIMFKEHQINNARPITNMECAEAFAQAKSILN